VPQRLHSIITYRVNPRSPRLLRTLFKSRKGPSLMKQIELCSRDAIAAALRRCERRRRGLWAGASSLCDLVSRAFGECNISCRRHSERQLGMAMHSGSWRRYCCSRCAFLIFMPCHAPILRHTHFPLRFKKRTSLPNIPEARGPQARSTAFPVISFFETGLFRFAPHSQYGPAAASLSSRSSPCSLAV